MLMANDTRTGNGAALHTVSVLAFMGEPPPRQFLDRAELMPMRNVTMLGGDGGTGKSLLAAQLAVACTSGTLWLGIEVLTGPVLYISAEDDSDELWNRVHEICQADGIDKASCSGLEFLMKAGEDAALATEDRRMTRMVPTKLYQELDRMIGERSPVLVIIDNLADAYSGNENSRPLVKQFVGLLRGLAIRHDCVVVLLAHPSQAGRSSGTGESGSTAWNNSVRSRLYLHRCLDGDGSEPDETKRELQTMKANYAAKGEPVPLQWQAGRFVRSEKVKLFDGVPSDIVTRIQAAFRGKKYRVSVQSLQWAGFKVAEILDLDAGIGVPARDLTAEQRKARQRIAKMLALWVQSKSIRIVKDADEHREQRPFYDVAAP